MAEFFSEVGSLGLGSRLRRLSDLLMADGATIYKSANRSFKPAWFPLFHELTHGGQRALGELAERIGVSHASVNQIAADLEANGLIESTKDPADARCRIVALTAQGRALASELAEVWDGIRLAIDGAITDSGYDLVSAIGQLERALERRSFAQRFTDHWHRVEIVHFEDCHAKAFRDLNLEWISRYFIVEPIDAEMLAHPQERILEPGGSIVMAIEPRTGRAVGTCTLFPHGEDWELAKMAVSPDAQGRGIGRKLAQAIIDEARQQGLPRLVLETNSKLVPAIKLYESVGFRHARNPHPSDYARSNVYMVLNL